MLVRTICFLIITMPFGRGAELPALFQRLEDTAVGQPGTTEAESEIASEIQKIGASAVPGLMALLKHENAGVRTLAGYTLRDIDGLTPEHMEPLIEAYRRGSGWLPPAIARTGNPAAASFCIDEYFRKRQIQNQIEWAIELLGEQAVQPLVTAIRKQTKWDDSLRRCVSHIFAELGPKAKSGVPMLMDLARDELGAEEARVVALSAIGALGRAAMDAVPLLNEMRLGRSKGLREAAEDALIGTGSPDGMALMVERFRRDPNVSYLRDIAEHGDRAKVIGSEVTGYLEHEDWDIRLGAARTLGFIGYRNAAPGLMKALRSPEDWRLAWAAAESLGRLRIAAARDVLEAAAKDHWYAPVREAAKTALQAIGGADPYAKQDEKEYHFSMQYFAHWEVDVDWELMEADLARIRFPQVQQKDEVSMTAPAGRALFRGIRVSNGQIVGSDEGEWGGKLVYLDRRNKVEVLAPVNTHAIYGGDDGAIALTGLAHMGMNDEMAYKVERDGNGNWSARKWRALPGAPRHARLIENGAILAVCTSGAVIVSPDGRIKELSREELIGP